MPGYIVFIRACNANVFGENYSSASNGRVKISFAFVPLSPYVFDFYNCTFAGRKAHSSGHRVRSAYMHVRPWRLTKRAKMERRERGEGQTRFTGGTLQTRTIECAAFYKVIMSCRCASTRHDSLCANNKINKFSRWPPFQMTVARFVKKGLRVCVLKDALSVPRANLFASEGRRSGDGSEFYPTLFSATYIRGRANNASLS